MIKKLHNLYKNQTDETQWELRLIAMLFPAVLAVTYLNYWS